MSAKFRAFKVLSMYWYCPRSSRRNEPEIPGRIIAQMAINPDMNITGSEWLAAIGFKPTNMYERTIPIAVTINILMLISSSCVYRIYDDARISPRKNENVYAVCSSSR